MKKHLFAIAAITIAFISCGPVYVVQSTPQTPPQEEAPEITYQTFYDDLSPYGQWIDYPEYGYVWMPNAGPDFRPYATNGQWVYTNDGWTWSSGYNWGWATFHYGRWFFDANYGWMWIPGYQWAPAWVSWRQSQDYYGWAPLGPRVNVDVAVSNYNPPANYWCFVPHQYVSSPSMSNYYVNETRNTTIINNTTVINNYTVNNVTNNNTNITNNHTTVNNNVRNNFVTGPDPREVSRFTGSTITPAVIRQSTSHTERFNNGQLEIYRPKVNANSTSNNNNNAANNNTQQRIAPTHFVPLSNARPMINRPVNSQPANNPNNNVRQEPANNTNTNPANTNNNPNRPNTNQNQQPVNNNNPNNNVRQQPANNTNTNPANTNQNPTRPNTNQNAQPVNNNNPNNNVRQQPANNTNNNPANTNQNQRPVNNNNPVQRNGQNNNPNNQNRNNRFNHQQDSIKRANKNIKAPKDNPKDQHN